MENCVLCIDGLVFEEDSKGTRTPWRCRCSLGEKHATPMYLPSDKEKKRPIVIPLYGTKTTRIDGRAKALGKDGE